MAADCKSVGVRLPRFESLTATQHKRPLANTDEIVGRSSFMSGAIRPYPAVHGQLRPIHALALGPCSGVAEAGMAWSHRE
jgi:hypothetical protein